jgi:hypothetical protein
VNHAAAQAQFSPYPIEMPNADQDIKLFLQGSLQHVTRSVRSLTTCGL